MPFVSSKKDDTLTVVANLHWIWSIFFAAGFLACGSFIYLQVEDFEFEMGDPVDVTVSAIAIVFLLLFVFFAFLQPSRENRFDMSRRILTRDIRTTVGVWPVDVELSKVQESEVHQFSRNLATGYGVRLLLGGGRTVPLAVELSWHRAEQLERQVRSSLLAVKYGRQ